VSTDHRAAQAPPDLDRAAALTLGLVDDAAVFPPGLAPYPEALRRHREHRDSWYADLVGPLVIPVSGLREFADALEDEGSTSDPFALVLVGDTGLVGLAQARAAMLDDTRVEAAGVEVALPVSDDLEDAARRTLASLDVAVPSAIEIPRAKGWRDALDVIADDGAERAKFRTGGPTPDHVPSDTELAAFISACLERRLPFKLTSGLHHLVRRTSPETGMEEHGVLNVMAAVAVATDGASIETVAEIVGLRDHRTVMAVLDTADAREVRRWFTSYGSCSIDEPRDDLVAAGLLHPPAAP
jgi:hypothetical protein